MKNRILWNPSISSLKSSNIYSFQKKINNKYNLSINNYSDLHKWSVDNLDCFWEEIWNFSNITFSEKYSKIKIDEKNIWDVKWFVDSKLNYAENLLRYKNDDIAIYFFGENKLRKTLTFNQLYKDVAKVAYSFKKMGLEKGDRVAAFIPNIPEAVIAMLATVSIGAVWSSCSPDFGVKGVLDRFSQINPKLVISSDGYYYKGNKFSCKEKLDKIVSSLSSVKNVIIANYINNGDANWNLLLDNKQQIIDFKQVDFSHPLYIMYSSGTTGKPKSIIHSTGGTLIQHYKEHLLHVNLNKQSKLFYFTTCGWMMWNWLVSSLAIGCSIVLYDGNPFYPNNDSLLKIMNDIDIDVFGTSAKYISTLESLSIYPNKYKFNSLKTILSTGSTLNGSSYDYVYNSWKKDVQLSSISGGTDIISCFALGNPALPVYKNELQCIGLGMSVKSYDSNATHKFNIKGELVCDKPFPSMPIGFWNDTDNKKYINAYFSYYPNIWKHGDYIKINNHQGVTIYGRSDTTLNPGGIRIGTSEIYQVIEKHQKIEDSVAVGQKISEDERIILFVKIKQDNILTDSLIAEIKQLIKNNCSPRHVPEYILQVKEIPYTINGKKVEIAIKNVIHNIKVANIDALINPECLEEYRIKVKGLSL